MPGPSPSPPRMRCSCRGCARWPSWRASRCCAPARSTSCWKPAGSQRSWARCSSPRSSIFSLHLLALPEALAFQAAAHAIRGEAEEMEARIAEALAAAPGDRDLLGGAWGRCRAMLSLLDEDLELAWEQMNTGAELTLASPAGPAPPFLGLWPLVGAILGR